MLSNLVEGFQLLLTLDVGIAILVGTVSGIVIGALPGLTTTIGLAVLIPLTFGLDPMVALGLIAGIYNGSMYGGAIPAVLLRIPGTPAAIATTFDGFPMTQQGNSSLALKVACYSSALGGMISAVSLVLLAPPLSKITLAFGPADYFWVAVLGLASISMLLGGDPLKGLISAALGLLVASVGMDLTTGQMRFTFGFLELMDGVNVVVVLIGLFAVPRVFAMAEEAAHRGVSAQDLRLSGQKFSWTIFMSLIPIWIRSGVIGVLVGILPGAGGNIAAFFSYNEAKRSSKDGATFGTGNPKGVAAAECGNSSDNGSSLIPTLTLGIPGNAIAALILGGLLVHGLQPGPALFRDNAGIVYGFMIQMFLASVLLLFLGGVMASRIFAQALRMPQILLAAMISGLMIVGIYTVTGRVFDLYMMLGFGLLGYVMERLKFPAAPMVLAVILGGMAETNLRTALLISRGDWSVLFSNTISQILLAMVGGLILMTLVRAGKQAFAPKNGQG